VSRLLNTMDWIAKVIDMLPSNRFFAVTGFVFGFNAFVYGVCNNRRMKMLDLKYDTENKKRENEVEALKGIIKTIQQDKAERKHQKYMREARR